MSPEDGEGWLSTLCGRAANAEQNSGPAVSCSSLSSEELQAAGGVFAQGSDPGWKLSKASCKHRLMGWGTDFKHYGKHLGHVPFK